METMPISHNVDIVSIKFYIIKDINPLLCYNLKYKCKGKQSLNLQGV